MSWMSTLMSCNFLARWIRTKEDHTKTETLNIKMFKVSALKKPTCWFISARLSGNKKTTRRDQFQGHKLLDWYKSDISVKNVYFNGTTLLEDDLLFHSVYCQVKFVILSMLVRINNIFHNEDKSADYKSA